MDFRHRPDTSQRRFKPRPGRLFGTPARQLGPLLCGVAIVIFGGCSVQAETSPNPAGQASSNPAHAIAEKFAASASDAAAAKARIEAEATEARRRLAEAKRKSEIAARQAADQRRRDELDILSRARLEAETRDAEARDAETRDREAREAAIAREVEAREVEVRAAEAREAEQLRLATDAAARADVMKADVTKAEAIAAPSTSTSSSDSAERDAAEALRQTQQAEREAETWRIVEKLRAARAAKAAEADRLQAELDARTAAVPEPTPAPTVAAAPPTRATIILALANGGRGIDRPGTTTADPVLCIGGTCYVSRGADRPASPMPRSAALGPGNTMGGRAGSCARSLICVYRDIEIGAGPASLQPVDLRLLRHDRREIASGLIDRTCNMTSGRLVCSLPVRAASWTAWIVPEATAATAGPAALNVAATGKLDSRTAAAN